MVLHESRGNNVMDFSEKYEYETLSEQEVFSRENPISDYIKQT